MYPLIKLIELEQQAEDFGLAWENTQQIFEQIQSEIDEIKEQLAINPSNQNLDLHSELADLCHAVISLCLFCKFDPNQTIEKSVTKFKTRLDLLKTLANEQGKTHLKGLSFDELMQYWDEVKKRESSSNSP